MLFMATNPLYPLLLSSNPSSSSYLELPPSASSPSNVEPLPSALFFRIPPTFLVLLMFPTLAQLKK